MIFNRLFRPRWQVLDFPYPYTGMVAINSDVEWTNWPLQLSLIRIFADYDLECAFSYWFFAGGDKTWRLFKQNGEPETVFESAVTLMRAGVLDTIHSFGGRRHAGGVEFKRRDILEGYQRLEDNGVTTKIFTNHGCELDTQNIAGDWGTYQLGDVPGSDIYHLDRTLKHGIRFFWGDIDYTVDRPFLKAGFGGKDKMFRMQTCRDGHDIVCFRRFLGKLNAGPCAENLEHQLESVLESRDAGYSIIYQHLGVHRHADGKAKSAVEPVFSEACHARLQALSAAQHSGRLLVSTSERLLVHAQLMSVRPWEIQQSEKKLVITWLKTPTHDGVCFSFSQEDFEGWAVRVPHDWEVECFMETVPVKLDRVMDGKDAVFHMPWHSLNMADILESCLSLSSH